MQLRSALDQSLMLKVIDKRNCSSPPAVCWPGCQVNERAAAKWVRVEMRAQPWPHANTSPPPAPHHRYCTHAAENPPHSKHKYHHAPVSSLSTMLTRPSGVSTFDITANKTALGGGSAPCSQSERPCRRGDPPIDQSLFVLL